MRVGCQAIWLLELKEYSQKIISVLDIMEGICHKEPIENNPSIDFIFNSNTYYTY